MHKSALKAAMISQCAKEQGRFWEMHNQLMAHQETLSDWKSHAESIQLDMPGFEACMQENKYEGAIRKDMELAAHFGITGTPSFILAKTDPEDASKVTGIQFIRGAQPFSVFKQAIDQALAEQE